MELIGYSLREPLATVCAHVRCVCGGGDGGTEGEAEGGAGELASLSRGCLGLAHGDR